MEELCILYGSGNIFDLSGAAFALYESFLGAGDDIVGLHIMGESPGEKASPDLIQAVCHGNGSVVVKVCGVTFFENEHSGAASPAFRGVMMEEEDLAEDV